MQFSVLKASITASLIALTMAHVSVVFSQQSNASETTAPAAKKPTPRKKKGQQSVLPETDPDSPRKSGLTGSSPDEQVLYVDVDKDNDPDIVERWWNGKRCRWFDENDDLLATQISGDTSDDSLQIDRDGDGYYDGPGDMNIDWVDDDNDGDADLQTIAMNPSATQAGVHAGESHYMIFEDVDDDNVHGYIDWQTFDFPCWRATNTTKYQSQEITSQPLFTSFSPDYNGNSIFLKAHLPPEFVEDPRYNWENPFAFYDMDGDGATEMAIRHCDSPIKKPGDSEIRVIDGTNEECYVTYDLDNDAQRGNEMDFDLTFRWTDGEKMDYRKYVHKHPKMPAPEWVLPYFRYTNWRKIDELIYVPHDKCYEESFKPKWKECWLTFDEDDDDHRWERVELLYPEHDGQEADPYSLGRWRGRDSGTSFGLCGHPQSDMLGDRGEYDMDYSGGAKIYIGKDARIHLYGAEWGAWTVDEKGKYWGSWPVLGDSSPEKPEKVEEIVLYKDTNNNGFLDEISYDYDGDRTPDLVVSLLEYGAEGKKADLVDPAKLKWEGMHKLFVQTANQSFQDALLVYRAAWKRGLVDRELDDLAISASTAEQYEHGWWLKEKLFRMVDRLLKEQSETGKNKTKDTREKWKKAYFSGDFKGMAEMLASEIPVSEIPMKSAGNSQ